MQFFSNSRLASVSSCREPAGWISDFKKELERECSPFSSDFASVRSTSVLTSTGTSTVWTVAKDYRSVRTGTYFVLVLVQVTEQVIYLPVGGR
jgi:hypothetical protein